MRGVWLFLLLAGWCSAGQDSYVLAGTVVNARTGQPVKRAQLTLVQVQASPAAPGASSHLLIDVPPAPAFSAGALTDVSGVFRFSGLAPAEYTVLVQKPHFVPSGRTIALGNSSQEDLRIDLSPLGTIEGKITDQHGQPVSGASVLLMRSRIVDGSRQTVAERSATTDDRGVFRCWDVEPGRYKVRAEVTGTGSIEYAGDFVPRIGGGYSGFVPTYFGGPTADSATPVVIEPGTDATADIAVALEPAYNVRGRLGNLQPGPTNFALASNGEDVASGRVAFNRTTGAFELFEVVSGGYTLRAAQGSSVAELPIVVKGGNLSGLEMALADGVKIPVNIQVLNQPPEEANQTGDGNGPAQRNSSSCMVSLLGGPAVGHRPPIWSPSNAPVPPGQYRVQINCFQAYVVSATMGNTDLAANPSITVARGADPEPIEIVARHGGGTIDVTIKIDTAQPEETLFVLAVPRRPAAEESLRLVPAPFQGQIAIDSLAPGDYTLYAFSNDQVEYRNPEFLDSLSGGESVHVEDGARAAVTIARVTE